MRALPKYLYHVKVYRNNCRYREFGTFNKVDAIILLRLIIPVGLREAKDMIEASGSGHLKASGSGHLNWHVYVDVTTYCSIDDCHSLAEYVVTSSTGRHMYCAEHVPAVQRLGFPPLM